MWKATSISLTSILALAACSGPSVRKDTSPPKFSYPVVWTELGPRTQILVRAVTPDLSCPSLQVDGKSQAMFVRAAATREFPITTCEAEISAGSKTAKIGSKNLSLPTIPKKILVIGDTGCRIKVGEHGNGLQACNDPEAWPFEKIAHAARKWNPDLIIHVGDYLYRENPCPSNFPGCSGSPSGDQWAAWNADFFTPAQELLPSAPWIFVRGNHESCARSGAGWFRLLDPRPLPEKCAERTDPYPIYSGALNLAVFDSTSAEDKTVDEEQVKYFTRQMNQVQKFQPPVKWLLTHKPFWVGMQDKGKAPKIFSQTLLAAEINSTLTQSLQLLLAGHVHFFSASVIEPGPVQIIAGNGGTQLLDVPKGSLDQFNMKSRLIKKNITLHQFGFLTLEAMTVPGQWQVIPHDVQGEPLKICVLKNTTLTCEDPKENKAPGTSG
jgi:hypothetical protein